MKAVFLDKKTLGLDVDFSAIERLVSLTSYEVTNDTQVLERIKDAEIIITNKVVLSAEVLKKCSDLKLICIAATGMNNIDHDYCQDNGIKVKNAIGYSTKSVVQHTFNLAFSLIGQTNYFNQYTSQKKWQESDTFTHHGRSYFEIAEKKWGIIGLGEIGRGVAKIAQAFGSEVQYYSTSGKNTKQDFKQVTLTELLETSDIVSIHAPLNEQTKNLLTEKELNLLKNKAVLINVGRGGIINEKDLVSVFKNKNIFVGLDVVESEPILENNPLNEIVSHDQFLLTPHIAWASQEARQKLIEMIGENIKSLHTHKVKDHHQ